MYCKEEASGSHSVDFSVGLPKCPHDMVSSFSQKELSKREEERNHSAIYVLILEVIHYYFVHILLAKISYKYREIKGERIRVYFLKEGVSKNFVNIL